MKPIIDVTATKTKTQSPVNVTARELTTEEKFRFEGSDVHSVKVELGSGPSPDEVAAHLVRSGGKTVVVKKASPKADEEK